MVFIATSFFQLGHARRADQAAPRASRTSPCSRGRGPYRGRCFSICPKAVKRAASPRSAGPLVRGSASAHVRKSAGPQIRVPEPRAREPRTADSVSSFDGQHPSVFACGRARRHRLLRRSRHERGAALDARQGRDPLRLHGEPGPAGRTGLRRHPPSRAAIRGREGPADRLPRRARQRRPLACCSAAPFTSRRPAWPTSTPRLSAARSLEHCSSRQ